MKYKSLRIFMFLVYWPVQPVVILVHGSFALHSSWWQPGGSFFETLKKHADELGHAVVPFMWSGQPDSTSIYGAGRRLAQVITTYSDEIILIGHSHGGNVINVASQKLKEMKAPSFDHLFLTLDVCPTLRIKKERLVKRVYLLGTPVDISVYAPDMDIIESVINLYSKGDCIQPVLGFFDRLYKGFDRVANISVSFKKKIDKKEKEPGHCFLYDPIIARLILCVPDVLKTHSIGGFELFSYAHNGHIVFDELMGALYSIVD